MKPGLARTLWHRLETINAVTYFAPECRDAPADLGLAGFWMGYFACRAAPLGPVGPGVVEATFYNFHPRRVRRAVPEAWARTTPAAVLEVRATAAAAALRRLVPAGGAEELAAGVVAALATVVAAADPAGRPLFAANRDVPRPDDPVADLWQLATTLREHRGDGHVAALVTTGLEPVEVVAWRCRVDQSREFHQPARGWTDEQWTAAEQRLVDKGWLTADLSPTPYATETFRVVEEATDRAASGPWRALGAERTARLRELLEPIATRCRTIIPAKAPIGLPAQRSAGAVLPR